MIFADSSVDLIDVLIVLGIVALALWIASLVLGRLRP